MKDSIRSLLSLSSGERKGVTVLMVIVLIILCIQAYRAFHVPDAKTIADSSLVKDLIEFEKHLSLKEDDPATLQEHFVFVEPEIEYDTAGFFRFDPNTVSAEDMKRLGLSSSIIRTLINYRQHGGVFRKPGDLKKIYGLNPSLYARLSPYISIPATAGRLPSVENKIPALDINIADTADLMAVKGIGMVLTARILKFRKSLGGFYSTGQLAEVYGISDSALVEISRLFYADTLKVRKINLNTASEAEMTRHPYIGKTVAGGIVRYRTSVDSIRSLDEMKTNGLMTGEQFKKVKKYLGI